MRGGVLVNWVASLPREDSADLPPEEWNCRAAKARLLRAFGNWRFPWIDVPATIESTAEIFLFPFVDREPLPWWTRDRVTLIGDAAHPMYPIGSQAGSQAIVDACVLAAALAAFRDPGEALRRYELERRPAMNDLAVSNRGLGAESVLQIVEERAPDGFTRLVDIISPDELDEIASGFKRLAGLDVESVNARDGWFGMAYSRA
jgi:5-methylphenazine-1-carboxylate 1-monooxygenase